MIKNMEVLLLTYCSKMSLVLPLSIGCLMKNCQINFFRFYLVCWLLFYTWYMQEKFIIWILIHNLT